MIFLYFSEKGIFNCTMVSGELKSDSEQYMENTATPHECQTRVKIRAPDANGVTWTHNNHECYAKFGSSESIIDDQGCSYCQSCYFGKTSYLNININFLLYYFDRNIY